MTSDIADTELVSILGLTVNISIGGDSIIGEIFYYNPENK